MVLAHKSDLLKAGASSATTPSVQAINRVKTVLERELEKRRASQAEESVLKASVVRVKGRIWAVWNAVVLVGLSGLQIGRAGT